MQWGLARAPWRSLATMRGENCVRARARNLLLCFVAAIVLAGCGSSGVRAPVEGRSASVSPTARLYHTVRRGDTLYSIAWSYGIDYKDVAAWNGIRSPYRIYPGERLRLTVRATKRTSAARGGGGHNSAKTRPPAVKSASSGAGSRQSRSRGDAASAKPAASVKKSTARAAKRVTWTWPAHGRLLRGFSQTGGKGVDIAGKQGQPVYAAGDGRVVYSGSGLLGYGKLIIVKHDKNYLSAYAHNHRILVSEGDKVASGQRIAQMGRTGADRVKLHFEIRRDGKPVDPLRYLPKT